MTPENGPQTAPEGLSDAGRRLWDQVAGTWDLRPDDARVLADACHEADLVDRLQSALADAPLMVKGSQGQQVASPLVQELRQHRSTLAALLRQLRLHEDAAEGEVSPATRSAVARSNARVRWDRHRGPAA